MARLMMSAMTLTGVTLAESSNLERDEQAGLYERQVLGPATDPPEADRFGNEHRRIRGKYHAGQVELRRAEGEQIVQVLHQSRVRVPDRPPDAPLQGGEDFRVLVMEEGPVLREQDDRRSQQP